MFAVPGWNVAASSLTTQQASNKNNDGADNRSSKKRKRDADRTERDAAADRLLSEQVKDKHLLKGSAQAEAQELKDPTSKPADALEDGINNAKVQQQSIKSTPSRTSANLDDTQSSTLIGPEHRRERKKQRKQLEKMQNGAIHETQTGKTPDLSSQPPPPKKRSTIPPAPPAIPSTTSKLTPLQAKMRSKLTSARFRHLNETLYTTSSTEALNLFTSSPELFADYHAGFAQQVKESWPQNPVDVYIQTIKIRGAQSPTGIPLPRRKTGSCTIADLGCGDAPLARGCQSVVKTLQLKFHNYDLHTPNTFVTKADISNLPLRDGEADIAVFCLSLMGTNWISFVEEAWRVLRGDGKGEVWVAEVKSRFGRASRGRVVENSVGKRRKIPKTKQLDDNAYDGPEQFVQTIHDEEDGDVKDETDVSAFVQVFTKRGFQLRPGSVDLRNKMFVSMVFTKTGIPTAGKHKGLKWNGKEYVRTESESRGGPSKGGVQPKFITAAKKGAGNHDDVSVEEEAKVLKPCVYKVR